MHRVATCPRNFNVRQEMHRIAVLMDCLEQSLTEQTARRMMPNFWISRSVKRRHIHESCQCSHWRVRPRPHCEDVAARDPIRSLRARGVWGS